MFFKSLPDEVTVMAVAVVGTGWAHNVVAQDFVAVHVVTVTDVDGHPDLDWPWATAMVLPVHRTETERKEEGL
jgi:hypothetical protein